MFSHQLVIILIRNITRALNAHRRLLVSAGSAGGCSEVRDGQYELWLRWSQCSSRSLRGAVAPLCYQSRAESTPVVRLPLGSACALQGLSLCG